MSKQTQIKYTTKIVCVPVVYLAPDILLIHSVFLISHLLINFEFYKNNMNDNYHTYTNPPSINHSKYQPKSAARISFCHNSILVISYSVA